ncbi:MliC family protein [Marinospirillum sp.]|uniref:MliC family protein n=1 Tax=Marinospirillum sp. TaxID=2183934 RepID=UPI0028709CA0|nr:MliC family protein [Marinospirillum sp.]MDR9469135.1 MliC family protein [Marinospirillum sp.]
MTCPCWIKIPLIGLLASLLLAGCSSLQPAPEFEDALQGQVWICDGQDVMESRQAGERLWLQLPGSDSWIAMETARAASGSLFQNQSSNTSFWSKGKRARVQTPQKTWIQCQLENEGDITELEHPQIAGTDNSPEAITLKARGSYPGWSLEVRQKGSGTLTFNYGTEAIEFTDVKQTHQDLITRRYQAQTQDDEQLEYKVDNIMCIDVNSGEPFQHRVEVTFQEQQYKGCGQSF